MFSSLQSVYEKYENMQLRNWSIVTQLNVSLHYNLYMCTLNKAYAYWWGFVESLHGKVLLFALPEFKNLYVLKIYKSTMSTIST